MGTRLLRRLAAMAAHAVPWRKKLAALLALVALASGGEQARAGYLTPAYEAQLESWLGEGNLNFNLLFQKNAGDGKTSLSFHSAADGQGRTITLIKVASVRDQFGNVVEGEQFIGGYNPQSWNSSNTYTITPNVVDRTAFLFNLTDDVILRQKLTSEGQYQTANYSGNGPTFGGGIDLDTYGDMEQGSAVQYSYGPGAYNTSNVFGGPYQSQGFFTIAGFEVYTLAPAEAVATPAPPGVVLAGVGAVMMVGGAWFRRRNPLAAA
jgi:hypothetical protein